MARVYNFSAGPSMMPEAVLARAREEMLDWRGRGLSVMEMPFTGESYREIAASATADLREILGVPPNYRILFMHGGAMAQFALVPMNLLRGREVADYVDSGYWAGRAIKEAARYCRINLAASGAANGYTDIPPMPEWRPDPDAAYCHITTNETANGVEFHWTPETGGTPLVADMTSNFLTRPLDVARYGAIYASAQKNIGPAGVTVVILREDLIGGAHPMTPSVFDFAVQARENSRYNTPATYGVYIAGLVFAWLKEKGGLREMERANIRKSGKLYDLIDASGFYRCPAAPGARSRVNVCFSLADESLEDAFLREAEAEGLVNLKGHGQVGGFRASLYNAMPEEGVDALAALMKDFARRHG